MNTLHRQSYRQNYRPRPLLRFPPWLRSLWVWL
jgi:hypothetical protein